MSKSAPLPRFRSWFDPEGTWHSATREQAAQALRRHRAAKAIQQTARPGTYVLWTGALGFDRVTIITRDT